MKTMFLAMFLGAVSLISGCSTVPYTKLSNEVSVKHVGWVGQQFVHYEANIKNTSDKTLSLRVFCDTDGGEKVYNVKIPPRQEEKITQSVLKPQSKQTTLASTMKCNFYKYNW